MKNLKRSLPSQLLVVLLFCAGSMLAQTQQKVKKNYPVNSDVAIQVEAQHTKLLVETWNKNEMQIEAFIDTKGLSEEEVAAALESWQVSVKGDRSSMNIQSSGNSSWNSFPGPPGMDSLGSMTAEMIGPLMNNLVGPMLESFSTQPLPPEFMEGVGSIKFDHEAYKRDGEKYLKNWEKEIESKFGKEFEASMEEWGKSFEKDSEKWAAKMEVEMEAWGEKFGKDMEKWAESFGKDMEVWGEQFGKEMEKWAAEMERSEGENISNSFSITVSSDNSNAKRTLIIRIPKDAELKLDVRHGEVQLPEQVNNLRAQLSHSKLTANTISGQNTVIEASYTPVKVKNWEYGVLTANYVKNCSIEQAESLKLVSTSSDVKIGKIGETGIISGTFANLDILEVASDFQTLDISLENSELNLNLPDSAMNFNYTGSQSKIEYPSNLEVEKSKSYDREIINSNNRKGSGRVNIQARYSDVSIK